MKRQSNWLLGAALACASLFLAGSAAAQVTLEVMNPRGEIPPPKTLGISPRGGKLDGKKIVLIDNGKFGADNFLNVRRADHQAEISRRHGRDVPEAFRADHHRSSQVVSHGEAAGRSFRFRCR